jgi:hypothetical protein
MSQGDTHIYAVRGARPRPVPSEGLEHSTWRGPLIVAAIMIGWMLFVLALAAFAAPAGPNRAVPVQAGRGVVVMPADGWTSAAGVWQVGPNAVSLKRAGAVAVFAAEAYGGSDQELMAFQLNDLERQFDSYRALPVASSTIAGDLPALTALFLGTQDSSRLEGELVVATRAGTGVVMRVIAPSGQLSRVQADIETMLGNMVVPR